MNTSVGYRLIGLGNNDTLQNLKSIESDRINTLIWQESVWYEKSVIRSEIDALNKGVLIEVSDDGDRYRLIWTLRTRTQPKSLTPKAFILLLELLNIWYESLKNYDGIDNIYLSISSLYRTLDLQSELSKTTHMASTGFSSHTTGMAFDIHARGYYSGYDRHSVVALSEEFDPLYINVIKAILENAEKQGLCHVIVEKGYRLEIDTVIEYDACYHVCVSPDFLTKARDI